MFAIETELGRFEADTEKEAKKKLRAAIKKQAEIDERENGLRDLAYLRAYKAAYNFYDRQGRHEPMPNGWRLKPVSEKSYGVFSKWDEARNERGYSIETADGRAMVYPYDDITHYVENGSGFVMAVRISHQDCELFAVGVNEERCAWVPLFGVSPTEFKHIG